MVYRNAPLIVLGVFLCTIYVIYISDDGSNNSKPKSAINIDNKTASSVYKYSNGRPPANLKVVLYWNEFYGRYDTYDFGYGHEAFAEKCPSGASSACFATKDRSLKAEPDAVIVHIRGLPNDWPRVRTPKQRFVMLAVEAPVHLSEYRDLDRLGFNWTMTYRRDSDFPIPYAWIDQVKLLPAPKESTLLQRYIIKFGQRALDEGPNLAEDKVGLAVQFASTYCHSSGRRESYVRRLRQHIPVDVYGSCGNFKCREEHQDHWECFRAVGQRYKFLLAFEPALCRDYATERFFAAYVTGVDGDSGAAANIVPVVLGAGAEYYASVAPPHSYIDASAFAGPRELAHFLKLLDADDARFNEYFWWRDYFERRFHYHRAMCELCRRLNEDTAVKVYDHMEDWWVRRAECTSSEEDDRVWLTRK